MNTTARDPWRLPALDGLSGQLRRAETAADHPRENALEHEALRVSRTGQRGEPGPTGETAGEGAARRS